MQYDVAFRNLDNSVVIGVRLRAGYQRNGPIPNRDKDNSLLLKGPDWPRCSHNLQSKGTGVSSRRVYMVRTSSRQVTSIWCRNEESLYFAICLYRDSAGQFLYCCKVHNEHQFFHAATKTTDFPSVVSVRGLRCEEGGVAYVGIIFFDKLSKIFKFVEYN
jgi:hypothetical protein